MAEDDVIQNGRRHAEHLGNLTQENTEEKMGGKNEKRELKRNENMVPNLVFVILK